MFLLFRKIIIYAFLTCFKEMVEQDLNELKKYFKKEVINNELKFNDNSGVSKSN